MIINHSSYFTLRCELANNSSIISFEISPLSSSFFRNSSLSTAALGIFSALFLVRYPVKTGSSMIASLKSAFSHNRPSRYPLHPIIIEEVRRVFERSARERSARERSARERSARERSARERSARERSARETIAIERSASERLARERSARERSARERSASERLAPESLVYERYLFEHSVYSYRYY
jgi:hypothetical protein